MPKKGLQIPLPLFGKQVAVEGSLIKIKGLNRKSAAALEQLQYD